MSANFQRAAVLFQQSRYDLAERELRLSLADDPGDPVAHAFLALCLVRLDRLDEATREAGEAIRLGPDLVLGHYAMGSALYHRNRFEDAEAAASEAIRLDPTDSDTYALLAQIRCNRRRWRDALASAEQGLAFDPEHVACNNLRALALVKLGRRAEAGTTLDSVLSRDPEDPLTHSNRGWALLHEGKPREALVHFREALRIEPNFEWARAGIVEALKAKNPIYRLMLLYFLAMSRLTNRAQWAVILALVFGRQFVQSIGRAYPALAPFTGAALIALFAFIVLTWISVPLFNLLLRLSRFGRLALSAEQVVASNWLAAYLVSGAACLIVGLIRRDDRAMEAAIDFGLLLLPVGGTFGCPAGWPRDAMKAATLALTLIGPGAIAAMMFLDPESPWWYRAHAWHENFPTGVMLSTWAGVFLSQARMRK